MDITVQEAADALGVCRPTVVRWYTGSKTADAPRNFSVESNTLCTILGLDHRFLMAWLTGYDAALTVAQAAAFTGKTARWFYTTKKIKPVVLYVPGKRPYGMGVYKRFSQRQLIPYTEVFKERHDERKLRAFGGRGLGLPPDQLDPLSKVLEFHSILEKKGTGLPPPFQARRARRANPDTTLDPGVCSDLPRY